jgi:hypothetical protein
MTSSDDFAIDALAGFLPLAARDRLAETLTAAEIDTLTHLARAGTGPNSLRALASDLAYLEAWAHASTDAPLVWPASEATVLRFIAHHLWDEEEREKNPEHGMPQEIEAVLRAAGRLRTSGPHAPATVRRRPALWATLHRWRAAEGPFGAPSIRNALRLRPADDRPRAFLERRGKSKVAAQKYRSGTRTRSPGRTGMIGDNGYSLKPCSPTC